MTHRLETKIRMNKEFAVLLGYQGAGNADVGTFTQTEIISTHREFICSSNIPASLYLA
jgi:hypothetical protein